MAKGILIATFDFSTCAEDEFNDWYDLEHIPERERVPGFLVVRRWIDVTNPKVSLVTYELDGLDVLKSTPYRAIGYEKASVWTKRVTGLCRRLLRFEGEQILPGDAVGPPDAGAVLVSALNVEAAHDADADRWLAEEHIPNLAAVPGCRLARWYRSGAPGSAYHYAGGGAHRHLTVCHLDSPSVTGTSAWRDAVETAWTARLRPHGRDRIDLLCRPYVRSGASA